MCGTRLVIDESVEGDVLVAVIDESLHVHHIAMRCCVGRRICGRSWDLRRERGGRRGSVEERDEREEGCERKCTHVDNYSL